MIRAGIGSEEVRLRLGVLQLRRAPRRTVGLVLSVATLTVLVLLVSAISSTLVRSLSGALADMDADVIVLTEASQGTPQASRIPPESLEAIADVDGVGVLAPVGEIRVAVLVEGQRLDASLFGIEQGGPGGPRELAEGRLPSAPTEAVIDDTERRRGLGIGDQIEVAGTDVVLDVVGVADGSRFGGVMTIHAPYGTWESVFGQLFPDATELRASLIAVIADSTEPGVLAERITSRVEGVEARTRSQAVADLPGMSGIRDSFRLIGAIAIGSALLLIGAFWFMVTAHQTRTLAVLRSTGVAEGDLVRALVAQVVLVVLSGVLVATGLILVLARAAPPNFPLDPDPIMVSVLTALLVAGSLVAVVPAARRVIRVDPLLALSWARR